METADEQQRSRASWRCLRPGHGVAWHRADQQTSRAQPRWWRGEIWPHILEVHRKVAGNLPRHEEQVVKRAKAPLVCPSPGCNPSWQGTRWQPESPRTTRTACTERGRLSANYPTPPPTLSIVWPGASPSAGLRCHLLRSLGHSVCSSRPHDSVPRWADPCLRELYTACGRRCCTAGHVTLRPVDPRLAPTCIGAGSAWPAREDIIRIAVIRDRCQPVWSVVTVTALWPKSRLAG